MDNIEIGIDDTSIGDPNAFGNQAHVDEVIEPIQDSSIFGGDDSSSSSKGNIKPKVQRHFHQRMPVASKEIQ